MDSKKIAQNIYTQAIYNARNIGKITFGNCDCQFNIAKKFFLSEESAKNVIVYLYWYVKYDYIHDFEDRLEQHVFDVLSWYIEELCMCGSTYINITANHAIMTIDLVNRDMLSLDMLLSLDVGNKVYLYGVCKLSSNDTDEHFNININNYFYIYNEEETKYYLKTVYGYCTRTLFLDEHTNKKEEYIAQAIFYAIISSSVKDYDFIYNHDSIIIYDKDR